VPGHLGKGDSGGHRGVERLDRPGERDAHPHVAGLADDDGERCRGDGLPVTAISDPADLVISAERIRALQEHFDTVLSDLEAEVLRLYVDGKSYQEIAEVLKRHVKSIDNALQRIKRKLDGHLRAREIADAG
jgi:RNA polymerase sporulation-specific sigma factor